jgi:endonuclease G
MAIGDRQDLIDQIEEDAWKRRQARGPKGQDTQEDERRRYRQRLARYNRVITNERLIGQSDLLGINYLERGMRASRAVCRIEIRDERSRVVGHGTGFLVGPRLLLTNQHVLLDKIEARHSLAEFDYENDVSSLPRPSIVFRLEPHVLYESDRALDFALVAVEPIAVDGTSALDAFGHVKLRPQSGKALMGEHVSIIQHPSGAPKQIAVRANRVVDVFDRYIRYKTDTEPGSSGAPVFSDEWEVVALHHAGVKERDKQGRVVNVDGGVWTPDQGEDAIRWESNEGIRVSRILTHLQERIADGETRTGRLLREVVRDADPASGPYVWIRGDASEERRTGSWYEEAEGYRADFLGDEAVLPLPSVVLASHDAQDTLLYRHFSIVMSASRRQPLFTACNIDGDLLVSSSRSVGWKTDPRLENHDQLNNDFYKDRPYQPNPFDRGHMVRRLDPSWDDIALEAIDDTFHFTNAALQHKSFNNGIWGKLEDAVLARAGRTLMTVFTGPILSPGDPAVRVPREDGVDEARVPLEYWKVIAFADNEGLLAAAGFRQSQAATVQAMDLDFTEEEAPERAPEAHIDTFLTFQVPILEIEADTGLDFHFLRDFDATTDQLEAERRRPVRGPSDLLLRRPEAERRRVGVLGSNYVSDYGADKGSKVQQQKPPKPGKKRKKD